MKTVFAVLVLIVAIFGIWWFGFREKQEVAKVKDVPLEVPGHSAPFNESVDDVMKSYFNIKSAFVDVDTMKAKLESRRFLSLLDSIKTDEFKGDSLGILESIRVQIEDIKNNAVALLGETNVTEMRQGFRMISENLYPFLKTIKYEGPTLYWQNCPMAFGEEKEANWISDTREIINPYLGKNHPEYKNSMLHCGEIKDTIK